MASRYLPSLYYSLDSAWPRGSLSTSLLLLGIGLLLLKDLLRRGVRAEGLSSLPHSAGKGPWQSLSGCSAS